MRIAVVPGSFDPITKGHMDIILRAKDLFDKVIVLVVINTEKKPAFTPEERVIMIEKVTQGYDNIITDCFDGLLVDYVERVGACAIVSDFEYEFQMALYNKRLYEPAETVFLTTSTENLYLSSSGVKQIAAFGRDISDFVPQEICEEIYQRLYKKKGE